ncbi:hypothetical protein KIPB_003343 [Kipferlia bialata]|uniref:Uncharacterized protein n=1 Tax=Kipferlia bialata TaxID=797122 RepID=A0A9K3GGZ9_9EUKA|nr:hypothetical protein KIPB_003343 [Kipferlia bialata]|eukprot:g3343.t1
MQGVGQYPTRGDTAQGQQRGQHPYDNGRGAGMVGERGMNGQRGGGPYYAPNQQMPSAPGPMYPQAPVSVSHASYISEAEAVPGPYSTGAPYSQGAAVGTGGYLPTTQRPGGIPDHPPAGVYATADDTHLSDDSDGGTVPEGQSLLEYISTMLPSLPQSPQRQMKGERGEDAYEGKTDTQSLTSAVHVPPSSAGSLSYIAPPPRVPTPSDPALPLPPPEPISAQPPLSATSVARLVPNPPSPRAVRERERERDPRLSGTASLPTSLGSGLVSGGYDTTHTRSRPVPRPVPVTPSPLQVNRASLILDMMREKEREGTQQQGITRARPHTQHTLDHYRPSGAITEAVTQPKTASAGSDPLKSYIAARSAIRSERQQLLSLAHVPILTQPSESPTSTHVAKGTPKTDTAGYDLDRMPVSGVIDPSHLRSVSASVASVGPASVTPSAWHQSLGQEASRPAQHTQAEWSDAGSVTHLEQDQQGMGSDEMSLITMLNM